MVGLNPNAIALAYAVGAALLGLWLFVRYPSLGPRTFKAAFLLVACAFNRDQHAGQLISIDDASRQNDLTTVIPHDSSLQRLKKCGVHFFVGRMSKMLHVEISWCSPSILY